MLTLSLAAMLCLAQPGAFRVLVYTRTMGFRHDSIPAGVEALRRASRAGGFEVEWTEDPAYFRDELLESFDCVVFLNTTGDVLDDTQQAAFERYIRGGGGYVGVHAAADTEYDWPFYAGLVGAHFESHPAIQPASVIVADRFHATTSHLPERWGRTDEWYNFKRSPRGSVHVLAVLDERSYQGGSLGHDHPIAWCHEYEGGRAFYTGGGHTIESYAEPAFVRHLTAGVRWAAGVEMGGGSSRDSAATIDACFEKTILDEDVLDPMELSVANDGRVFFIERAGAVKVWRPDTARTHLVGHVPTFSKLEDGLLGLTLDPAFDENGWAYIYYAPPDSTPRNRLSRFTIIDNLLVPGSESMILEVGTQRDECCHSGGSLSFGPDGCLYLSTGDNTNPFASDGFAPIDERPGRSPWDAQKSAANPNDLRGKVLRILPSPEGGYEIPEGNLFRPGTPGTRPEIFAMGCRNPFRISIDPRRGWLYWGDVGPDAGSPSDTRGPAGHDEFNRAKAPGFFGWPLVIADNKPYHDFDFETSTPGEPFDPAAPVNDSPNNTGVHDLPPAQPAWIPYPYAKSERFPELGDGSRTAMAGPTFYFDAIEPSRRAPTALPRYYDHTLFLYEWSRNWIMACRLDAAGEILDLHPFMASTVFRRPMDLELGPDGRLYAIDWGSEFGGLNSDSVIARLDFLGTRERPPAATFSLDVSEGLAPLEVRADASASRARVEGRPLDLSWDFDADGRPDAAGPAASHTYTTSGWHDVTLIARDPVAALESRSTRRVAVGNTSPQVKILSPPDGLFVDAGEVVPIIARVIDRDPWTASIDVVARTPSHERPIASFDGTRADWTVPADCVDPKTEPAARATIAIRARALDEGVPALDAIATATLRARRLECEDFTTNQGTVIEGVTDPQGGTSSIAYIEAGDHVSYAPVNLLNVSRLRLRVASATKGGTIEIRLGAADGPLLAAPVVPPTGGWQNWVDIEVPIADPGGTHALFLVFVAGAPHADPPVPPGDEPRGALLNVNWIDFLR